MLLRYVDAQNEVCKFARSRAYRKVAWLIRKFNTWFAQGRLAYSQGQTRFSQDWPISQGRGSFAQDSMLYSQVSNAVCASSLGLFARSNPFLARSAFCARSTLVCARSTALFASSIPVLSKLPIYI